MSDKEEITQEVFKRIDMIGHKVTEVAPIAWNKMVLFTQAESIAHLGVGGICFIIFLGCLALMLSSWKAYKNLKNPIYDEGPGPGFWIGLGVGTIFLFPAIINLLYVWNWIGAFVPEARLISRMIAMVTPHEQS